MDASDHLRSPALVDQQLPTERVIDHHVSLLSGLLPAQESFAATNPVDATKSAGEDEPGERVGRHALAGPLFGRSDGSIVQCIFGCVAAAEQPHLRRIHTPALLSKQRGHEFVHGCRPKNWQYGFACKPRDECRISTFGDSAMPPSELVIAQNHGGARSWESGHQLLADGLRWFLRHRFATRPSWCNWPQRSSTFTRSIRTRA